MPEDDKLLYLRKTYAMLTAEEKKRLHPAVLGRAFTVQDIDDILWRRDEGRPL